MKNMMKIIPVISILKICEQMKDSSIKGTEAFLGGSGALRPMHHPRMTGSFKAVKQKMATMGT
jgi:hypothetical protein